MAGPMKRYFFPLAWFMAAFVALLAAGLTLAIATVWQFLAVCRTIAGGPQWVGTPWLGMQRIATPPARWRV